MLQTPIGNKKGGLTVEILVVIAIIAFALASLSKLVSFSLDASRLSWHNTQASILAQEEMEALRNFRDGIPWYNNDPGNQYDGLGVVATGTNYYVRKSADNPPKWQLIQGQETINSFFRKIIFSDVQRAANGDIVSSGGINDPETKKASVSVFWMEKGRPRQMFVDTYFTNWKK
jgi:type II secretory pathway pseudopilin PulG